MQARRSSNRQIVRLDTGARIGSGGEGNIYPVVSDSALVAKVYHHPDQSRAHKLAIMVAAPPHDPFIKQGHRSIAWPNDLLLDEKEKVIGYLMPRVTEMKTLLNAYHPGARRKWCPTFNYLYLHQTAANLALAVAAVHERGYVIGDVNESNILLNVRTRVTLVDTDSFQVRDPNSGAVYRCTVGKPEFTPPELVDKSLATVDRTAEHDRFGLAVLIFHLLMQGSHPFDGLYVGSGEDPAIEKRISSGHFPLGVRPTPYRPISRALPFDTLHPDLRQLFGRCFEVGHTTPSLRPAAREWYETLTQAIGDLQGCRHNKEHHYGKHLASCPWCAWAKRYGADPFAAKPPPQARQPFAPAQAPAAGTRPTQPAAVRPAPAPMPAMRTAATVATHAAPPATGAWPRFVASRRGFAAIAALLILAGSGWGISQFRASPSAPKPLPLKISGDKAVNPQDGAELILIPAGSFKMGDDDENDNPRHPVKLSGYWIYQNPVTVWQYKKFCQATGHQMPDAPSFDSSWSQENHPIVNVSWDDAKAYCEWAGVKLPTEAQWEKAARGTEGRKYPWGNDWDASRCANSVGQSRSGTASVGSYRSGASPYGVLDMAGNVWQWCSDYYDADYCKSDHGENPKGPPSGDRRVLRGGSWLYTYPLYFRSAIRLWNLPAHRLLTNGFRGASGL